MGTEVLRPHDVLAERFRIPPTTSFHRRKFFPANGNLTNLFVDKRPHNNSGHKKTSPRPDKKKHAEVKKPRDAALARRKDDVTNTVPVTGKVTLLRRGESLDSLSSKINGGRLNLKGVKSPNQKPTDDLAVCGTERIGPESPVMLPKQIRLGGPPLADMYAGSAFSMSPSPRSLPLPSFFNKQSIATPFDNPATRDLRRLLRLE